MKNLLFIGLVFVAAISCQTQKYNNYKNIMSTDQFNQLKDGLYAYIETSKGNMLVELYPDQSPLTVANFVGLAEGTKENKSKPLGTPFYDGTVFHRIIKNFMIQGGDPNGTGMGGPGYSFADEKNELQHQGKGILSMANSGPDTNGSQFFITEVDTPWLNGKHTIFGKVIEGLDTVDNLSNTPTAAGDKPVEPVTLNKITIVRKGDKYKNYNGNEEFIKQEPLVKANNQKILDVQKKALEAQIKALTDGMQTTPSGLKYKITQTSQGIAPKKGDLLKVHYSGKLLDGREFDSSYKRNEPIEFPADSGKMIKGWDEGIMLLKEGEKAVFYIPSELAYGAREIGGIIPPNSDLIFELELVKVN